MKRLSLLLCAIICMASGFTSCYQGKNAGEEEENTLADYLRGSYEVEVFMDFPQEYFMDRMTTTMSILRLPGNKIKIKALDIEYYYEIFDINITGVELAGDEHEAILSYDGGVWMAPYYDYASLPVKVEGVISDRSDIDITIRITLPETVGNYEAIVKITDTQLSSAFR